MIATARRARVLLVDDDPRILAALRRQLHGRYEVVTAGGGIEGLSAIEAGEEFAVVISDMRMPGMDGATFLAAVRTVTPQTTRVLLTGQTEIGTAVRAISDGQAFRFLDKPCPPELLDRTLHDAVTRHQIACQDHRTVAAALADRRTTSTGTTDDGAERNSGLRPRTAQFQLRYRVVISLPTGSATAVQAVLHRDETAGADRPGTTEPPAPVRRWGVTAACQEVASWPARSAANPLGVHLRFSTDHLLDTLITDNLSQALALSGLPAERIVVEVDDTMVLQQAPISDRLSAMNALGVRLSLVHSDDELLARCIAGDVPFSSIKLSSRALMDVRSVALTVSRESGLETIADGVRSSDDQRAAVDAGCSGAQGPFYGHDEDPDCLLTQLFGLRQS